MNSDGQLFILNDAHHLVSYKLWSPQELRTLAKDFPKDAAIHFADEFDLIIQTSEAGLPDLYQLIWLLINEGQASQWYRTAGWNHPLV